jgi:outer membrane protein assembly factor BamA
LICRRHRLASACGLALCLLILSPARAGEPAPLPTPEQLEAAHAVIGKIEIDAGDVFDTRIKGEGGWLYRTANTLHINTRPSVVRNQLLFKTGDPYVHRLVQETERILRANDYLYEAVIVPVAWDGKTVDLMVHTRDNWTLNPGVNFSRKGGTNTGSVQIEERNLLGTGRQLSLDWGRNIDRDYLTFGYSDPHFLSTWTQLDLTYSDTSDGQTKYFKLDRPFYALDTRHAGGLALFDSLRNDFRYSLGHQVGEFQHREEYYEAYGGLSSGWHDGWVRRWTAGATLQRNRFDVLPDKALGGPLPEDRDLVYPWIGFDLVEDRYQERVNQDQILRTEDVLVGLRAGGRIGYSARALGADRDALIFNASFQDGTDLRSDESLFGSANLSGRLEGGTLRDAVLSAEARYYLRTSSRFKFFATANGTVTRNLDTESQLLLGGDTGLRGYPLRYQAGTSLALLTFEGRYYTDWYPFRLFHVAAAAFYDMGRTWGTDVTGATSLGLLKDVGIGLRLGSSRSAFGNVLHVDLAFPLDGDSSISNVQFVIETKNRF